jgi:hypothetical protein
MRISLGIITREDVNIETVACLMHMLQCSPHEFHLNLRKGTYVQEMRNDCVKEARSVNADYLFFIDSDMIFPGDGLNRLLAHNKDIIGGMYNMKQLPLVTTIKLCNDKGERLFLKPEDIPSTLDIPKDRIFKVYGIPTGFLLIKLSAIEDLENPFDFDRDENGLIIGEDINFCIKCKEIGLDIWCDPTIQIGHIGSYVY